jgi:UDP-N-acetylmuramoylalanine--D-glutamate ligase
MGYVEFFKGKKITMLGLGLLGRGVGDAEFLAQMGAQVLVTDMKTEKELEVSVEN